MKHSLLSPIVVALTASAITAHAGADSVAGIQLYPGGSSVDAEGSEKVITASGYPIGVCRHTPDSLEKVVAFYSKDKQLTSMGAPTKDNAGFYNKAGSSMSINSPWMNMRTFQMTNGTMICIAGKGK